MCREKSIQSQFLAAIVGSPLRVQGKASAGAGAVNRVGITPACAGKRMDEKLKQLVEQDHPCVCREKFVPAYRLRYHVGSPLRVQGKDGQVTAVDASYRITPACAGKSLPCECFPSVY